MSKAVFKNWNLSLSLLQLHSIHVHSITTFMGEIILKCKDYKYYVNMNH